MEAFILMIHLTFFTPNGQVPLRGSQIFHSETECLDFRDFMYEMRDEKHMGVEAVCHPYERQLTDI